MIPKFDYHLDHQEGVISLFVGILDDEETATIDIDWHALVTEIGLCVAGPDDFSVGVWKEHVDDEGCRTWVTLNAEDIANVCEQLSFLPKTALCRLFIRRAGPRSGINTTIAMLRRDPNNVWVFDPAETKRIYATVQPKQQPEELGE